MARMSRQELEQIVEQQRPGFRIVELDDTDGEAAADADARPVADRAPEVAALRRRAAEAGAGAPARTSKKPPPRAADEPEDEIVVVAPKDSGADPWKHGPGPKTIVVSGRNRRTGLSLARSGRPPAVAKNERRALGQYHHDAV
jgi:hypothetical protein